MLPSVNRALAKEMAETMESSNKNDLRALQRISLKDLQALKGGNLPEEEVIEKKSVLKAFLEQLRQIKKEKPSLKRVLVLSKDALSSLIDQLLYETVPVKEVYLGVE